MHLEYANLSWDLFLSGASADGREQMACLAPFEIVTSGSTPEAVLDSRRL